MRYLLDVNALVALGFSEHEFHYRVAAWIQSDKSPTILTCSITELGFIRVLALVPNYGITVTQARTLLLRMKKAEVIPFSFLRDDHDVSRLPLWVKSPKQTTDGHLAELAKANEALLATLDTRIPKAYLIP